MPDTKQPTIISKEKKTRDHKRNEERLNRIYEQRNKMMVYLK